MPLEKSLTDFFKIEDIALPDVGILDIGAMLLEGQAKEYQNLLDLAVARVVGFEPAEEECARLNNAFKGHKINFLPYFIGDGSRQTFCLNSASMTSSLYETNTEMVELFGNLPDLMRTEDRQEVQTTRLDDIREINFPVDYIKIDIQGAELQALEGADILLNNTMVIHTEVEWIPLYKDQPLFSEIELFLRKKGFLLHRITGFGSRPFKPALFKNNPNLGFQALWSDVVFVKDFTRTNVLSDRQVQVFALIMNDLYDAIDLTGMLLHRLGARTGQSLGTRYQEWLLEPAL